MLSRRSSELEEVVAGAAGEPGGHLEGAAELSFGDAVVEAHLLLLLQPPAEVVLPAADRLRAVGTGRIGTALTVLAGQAGERSSQAS